jgi:uncharacterized membrane protein (TIGR02234 family)
MRGGFLAAADAHGPVSAEGLRPMLAQMTHDLAATTHGRAARSRRSPARREFALVLLLAAAGAGLVILATRQGWAHVHTVAPKPLPSGVVTETGQDLVPAAVALAVAALASLAAVLATRRLLRRIAGVVLAGFGAGLAAAVGLGISAAHVLATAADGGPGASGGGATAAGSVTAGSVAAGSGTSGAPVTGLSGHVDFAGFPWHWLALLGAAAVMAAGVIVAWRADRLPVMSARYEPPAAAGTAAAGAAAAATPGAAGDRDRAGRDAATMWESLSRGEDPTAR